MKNVAIKGIIPPVITPMHPEDESVNIPELRNQVERQIAAGVHGIFPFGTNGEAYILSMGEKEEILEAVLDQVKGRIPVYAGAGCISTRDTVYLSKRAEAMGADVLSIITPSFALASQKELYDHYCEVARHVSIPIVLYNIPARTGNKLLPETVAADLRYHSAYWAQFEGLTAKVSTAIYDNALKSYGQTAGIQSYGTVVDLLVAYY